MIGLAKDDISFVGCAKCHAYLQGEALNTPGMVHCPSCGALIRVNVFPALFRKQPSGSSGEILLVDGEAGCFYHPKKKAVVSCSVCGRFLCALCDVEFSGQHLCTSCLETGKKKRKIKNIENHRTLFDSIVLTLAIVPMLLLWPSIITAPMVIFMAIRCWNAPTSIIPRTKARLIVALTLGSLQTIGWSFFIYNLATR